MQRKQVLAILLSATMMLPLCTPAGGFCVRAAENEDCSVAAEPDTTSGEADAIADREPGEESFMVPEDVNEDDSVSLETEIETPDLKETAEGEAETPDSEETAAEGETEIAEEENGNEFEARQNITESIEQETIIEEITEEITEETGTTAKKDIETEYQNATLIRLNEEKKVNFNEEAEALYYKFIAGEEGYYRVYSYNNDGTDPVAVVYDSELYEVASNDDSGDYNFSLSFYSESGATWYIETWNGYETATYTIRVEFWGEDAPDEESHDDSDDDELLVYADEYTVHANIGEKVTLSVEIYSERDTTCKWYKDGVEVQSNGADSYSFIMDGACTYKCVVSNGVNTETVEMQIIDANHFTVYPEGAGENPDGKKSNKISYDSVKQSEGIVLKVVVEATDKKDIKYKWYEACEHSYWGWPHDDTRPIEGNNQDTLMVNN